MRTLVSASVLSIILLAGCAHNRTGSEFVVLTSQEGVPIASVAVTSVPYTQGGPTATAWLSSGVGHTTDGRVVSGIMIRTWSESGAARVQVYGMTTKPGVAAAFTTEESQLEPVELGSYLLRHNQSVAIAEMVDLGIKPLFLRY